MADAYFKTLYPSGDWFPPEEGGNHWWLWSRDRDEVRLYVLGYLESGSGVFEFILEHGLAREQLDNLLVDIGGCAYRPQEVPLPPAFGGRRFFRCLFDIPSLAGRDLIEVRLRIRPRLRPCDLDPASPDTRVMGLAMGNAWFRSSYHPLGPAETYLDRRKVTYLDTGEVPSAAAWTDAAHNHVKLATLKNAHAGGRCFIIGNGPSLTIADLERLRHEVTFAANKIYLAFDHTDWRPTYYTVTDVVTAQCHRDRIASLPLTKVFNRCVAPFFPGAGDIVWFDADPAAFAHGEVVGPGFSDDLLRGSWPGFSVTFDQLQLACHMGFQKIYLLGVDFDYALAGPPVGRCEQGEILAYAGEANYFLPGYRQVGEPWTRPAFERMEAAYREARRRCDAAGRIVRNASRRSRLDAFERADFDALTAAGRPAGPASPLVSVIIPARDAADTIEEALASTLDQAGVRVEILLVDDGCRDDTVARARRVAGRHVTVLAHPDNAWRGVSASRRLALERATGALVAFLDADDAFLPGKLSAQASLMLANPDCILCHTDVEVADETGKAKGLAGYFHLGDLQRKYFLHESDDFLAQNRICNSSVMIRPDAARHFLDLRLRYQFEDWLHWIVLSSHGLFAYLPQRLVRYRYHAASFTARSTNTDQAFAAIEMLAALLQRPGHAFPRQRLVDALLRATDHLALLQANGPEAPPTPCARRPRDRGAQAAESSR
ncbi:MAG: glycosyltransferase [Solidesulfovibrio sp.]|uniref:glycosyltransferase family 2 protein n=1 Tax=Solidesulfovibrio sp. TaxID=2910990 RepID=UPI002B20E9BD|nr:glycosyltransferase [Solidesulfovibrio sp.]MEA4855580.1 glycosyltransferase [Solidesulfovibrio sp.]